MGRTLFVGCSHTMGYREDAPKDQPNVWRDNNYAEIYSQINDKKIGKSTINFGTEIAENVTNRKTI